VQVMTTEFEPGTSVSTVEVPVFLFLSASARPNSIYCSERADMQEDAAYVLIMPCGIIHVFHLCKLGSH
jgi:hypothetical protein